MVKHNNINVDGTSISIIKVNSEDYISLTDMIKNFGDEAIIKNWLRNRNTIEFLGVWEQLNNQNFNIVEFDQVKKDAGLNSFSISPKKWVELTNAIGILSKSGRYGGGTYAHKDIAFEFGSWLNAKFKLLLIQEFQRLKQAELAGAEWNYGRFLSKVNYRLHTDSIKENIIPNYNFPKNKEREIYLIIIMPKEKVKCDWCKKIVKPNKFLVGSLHICLTDTSKKKLVEVSQYYRDRYLNKV